MRLAGPMAVVAITALPGFSEMFLDMQGSSWGEWWGPLSQPVGQNVLPLLTVTLFPIQGVWWLLWLSELCPPFLLDLQFNVLFE